MYPDRSYNLYFSYICCNTSNFKSYKIPKHSNLEERWEEFKANRDQFFKEEWFPVYFKLDALTDQLDQVLYDPLEKEKQRKF